MRVLLVSYFFPPYNTVGSVRTGKTAKYLLKLGHDVRVLTALDPSLDAPIPRGMDLEIPADRVIATRWWDYNRLGKAWIRRQWKDRPLDQLSQPGSASHASQSSGFFGSCLRSAAALYRSAFNFPDGKIGWVPHAVRAAKKMSSDWTPDLILASSPPPTSLLVARRVSRALGRPWVADFRDLWTDNAAYSHPGWRKSLERKLEKRVLESASGIVTVSEPLAEKIQSRFSTPVRVIYNGYDPEDYRSLPRHIQKTGPLRLVFAGSVYATGYDLKPFFRALARVDAQPGAVEVDFFTSPSAHPAILNAAEEAGCSGQVRLHGWIPRSECLKVQCESDALLHFIWNDPQEKGVYSAKLFDYVGCGRPILAIGPSSGGAAQLIQDRGLGMVSNDPVEIAVQLKKWVQEKKSQGVASLDTASMSEFTRERQTGLLADFLETVLARKGGV